MDLKKVLAEMDRPDPLYRILPKFCAELDCLIPTVNMISEDVDELRRMLVQWESGDPIATVIVEKFALPAEDGIRS